MDQLYLPWRSWPLYRIILPVGAGCMMLFASILPWLNDPLGKDATAWQLSVDLGWQLRSAAFNYGLLCLCGTILLGMRTCQLWQAGLMNKEMKGLSTRHQYQLLGLLCTVPSLLFLYQYLITDMQSIATLTQTTLQLLLIQSHYGYHTDPTFIHIMPATFHALDIGDRSALIIDDLGPGFFLPLASAALMIGSSFLFPRIISHRRLLTLEQKRKRVALTALMLLLGSILFGRGILAQAMNYEAKHLLITGDYANVNKWLDYAILMNPELDALPEYHLERGQAWYYTHPQDSTADSMAYLAEYYYQQNDAIAANQTMLDAWNNYPHTQWLEDEYSHTLSQLIELNKPLIGNLTTRIHTENPTLGWLGRLAQLDPSNVYAQYMLGRILYDFRDYSGSEAHLQNILDLTRQDDVISSAYTYMSLDKTGLGEFVTAREYLFRAQDFDTAYHNNIAREEMSGMR